MDSDYPAAHSMDSTWFAVDKNGHVAIFETGEAGAMPEQAAGGDEFDPEGLGETLRLPQKREYGELVPDWSGAMYVYEHGDDYENWVSGPYTRRSAPKYPIVADLLPEPIRSELKQARFEDIAFADAPTLQPVDHLPCVSWEPAYVTGDGKRIRPISGMEGEYAEYHAEYFADGDLGSEFEVEPPSRPVQPRRNPTRQTPAQPKKPWWWPF